MKPQIRQFTNPDGTVAFRIIIDFKGNAVHGAALLAYDNNGRSLFHRHLSGLDEADTLRLVMTAMGLTYTLL